MSDEEIADYAHRSNLDGIAWTSDKTRPLLYWNMEGISGGGVTDLSGNDHNGTLLGNYKPAAGPELGDDVTPEPQEVVEDVPGSSIRVERFRDPDAGDTRFTVALEAAHGSVGLANTTGLALEEGAAGTHRVVYSGASEALNAALTALSYRPDANANGPDAVTMTVTDSGNGVPTQAKSVSRSYGIAVKAANDPPSFVKGADQQVEIDAPAQTVTGWATAVSPGPADEAGQQVAFTVENDRPELFAEPPSIDPDGTLHYRPAPGAAGEAIVSVTLRDDGGTADGGADTSAPQTFAIRIAPKQPRLTLGSAVMAEAPANDGSIAGSLAVELTNGTFAADMRGGVTVNHLPDGLGILVTRESDTRITVAFTGKADRHADADDVADASVTIGEAYIAGAEGPVTSGPFRFDFADPARSGSPHSGPTHSQPDGTAAVRGTSAGCDVLV